MKNKKNSLWAFIGGLIFVTVLVFLDQFTKHLAVLYLKGQQSISLIPKVMELEYLENRGAAFGILQNQQWLFILLFLVFVTLAVLWYSHLPQEKRYCPLFIITIFIIAGGLGNLIDRIRFGYVVDFFYFSLIDFPVFNVADIYVTVSVILLVLLFLFYYKEEDMDRLFPSSKNKR